MTENISKSFKQAVVAVLCSHPDAERYRRRAFTTESTAEILSHAQSLTKADFLIEDDGGKCFLDSPGGWKNFDKVISAISNNGEIFTSDDFLKPLKGSQQKSLLDSARINDALGKVFSFEVWQGRYEDMEKLWYKVPLPNRKALFQNQGMVSAALRKLLFDAENRVTPEERLAKSGLTPADVRAAFGSLSRGSIDDLNEKLKRNGDYLRKEYILMPDGAGDTVFDGRPAAWEKFERFIAIMEANGERLEVADFTRQVSFVKGILARAAEQHALPKVFSPSYWVDRLPDMLALWTSVLDGWKGGMSAREFDAAYAEAESLTYMKSFEARAVTGKTDLLKPLNTSSSKGKLVLPLGLKAVWEKFYVIQAALEGTPDGPLTVADLRAKSGEMDNSCLIAAAKFGFFDRVVLLARKNGDKLTLQDFLSKDKHGITLINLLAEKNQLALAFEPALWAGRVDDMRQLWAQVKVENRSQVDFRQAEIRAKQATLKQKAPVVTFKPRPRKQP